MANRWINGASAMSTSVSLAVTAGNLIIVTVGYTSAAGSPTLSDGTNTYTPVVLQQHPTVGASLAVFAFAAPSTGTLTFTASANSNDRMTVDQFANVSTTLLTSSTTTGTVAAGSDGNVNTGSVSPASSCLLFAVGYSTSLISPSLPAYPSSELGERIAQGIAQLNICTIYDGGNAGTYNLQFGLNNGANGGGGWYIMSLLAFQITGTLTPAVHAAETPVEIIKSASATVRVAEAVREVVHVANPLFRTTEVVVEAVKGANPNVRVPEMVIEVVVPFVPLPSNKIYEYIMPGG